MFLQGGDCFKKLTGNSFVLVLQCIRDRETLSCIACGIRVGCASQILRKYVANAKRDTFSSETLASNRRVVDVAVAFA